MHLVASLYEHLLDFPASSKILQTWISLCSMQTKYISNSQGHDEIDRGDGFLWKIIFYIFRFHEAALSLRSFSSTIVCPNFDNVFFPPYLFSHKITLFPFILIFFLFSFISFFLFFPSALLSYYNPTSMKRRFSFILLCYQTFIIQNETGTWLMVFASVQQTSLTICNLFQLSQFIFLLYFVSDYETICFITNKECFPYRGIPHSVEVSTQTAWAG